MKIKRERTGTLLEWLPKQIRAAHNQRQRLEKSLATAPFFTG